VSGGVQQVRVVLRVLALLLIQLCIDIGDAIFP